MSQEPCPYRLKELTPLAVRERLARRSTLLVPVGTTEQHGPHLPLGCDTILVERLADDLSAALGILRAPTVEYGVHTPTQPLPGGAALRRKTLHRVMNELIESWEVGAGVEEFVVLTAQSNEAHLEALSTIRADSAKVMVIDIFALDFAALHDDVGSPVHGGELDTSLLLHLAPHLVRMDLARDFELTPQLAARHRAGGKRLPHESPGSLGFPTRASAQKGAALYTFIFDRVYRCLAQP